MPLTSRKDEFQYQLAEWLLGQLNSRGAIETVTQQIDHLISQTPEQAIEDLYAHIGKLIFQKIAQVQAEGSKPCIRACSELCHSLSAVHFKHHPSLSPRVALIHEHIFHLCIEAVAPESTTELASEVSQLNENEILVEKVSDLLFNLWSFQLVSPVQICEYIFRVIENRSVSIGPKLVDAVVGVRFLLESCFLDYSHGPWKNQVNLFREWIDMHSNWKKCGTKDHNTINTKGVTNESPSLSTLVIHLPVGENLTPNSNIGSGDGNALPLNAIYNSASDYEFETEDTTRNNLGKPPYSGANKESDREGQEKENKTKDREREKAEEKKQDEEAKRKAKEEAKRKAEEETRRQEELQAKARAEAEQKAEKERNAREEAVRKVKEECKAKEAEKEEPQVRVQAERRLEERMHCEK